MLDLENIVEDYHEASIEKRVDMILRNFSNFEAIVDCCEKNLSVTIKEEIDYNRREELGDLGVRVQSSNISNPTLRDAANREEIERAIHNGEYYRILRWTDDFEKHRPQIITLQKMRNDFFRVSNVVNCLDPQNRRIFRKYISKEASVETLAEVEKLTHDSVRTRIKEARKTVRSCARREMRNGIDFAVLEKAVA